MFPIPKAKVVVDMLDLNNPDIVRKEGSVRISYEEERHIIKSILQNTKLKPGQKYYVINAKWWRLWQEYVGFDTGASSGHRPDKLDNHELLEEVKPSNERTNTMEISQTAVKQEKNEDSMKIDTSQMNGDSSTQGDDRDRFEEESQSIVLKKGLAAGADYEVIPEEAMYHLFLWYGGGPLIAREVIRVGALGSHVHLELYPISLLLVGNHNHGSQHMRLPQRHGRPVFLFSKSATIKEVRRVMAGALYCPPHKCTLSLLESADKQTPLEDSLNKTLEELGIVDGQTIHLKYLSDFGSSITDITLSTTMGSHNYTSYFVKRETHKEGTPPVNGATGLYNLGNTCFMNSVIQCLSNTAQLTDYFTNDLFTEEMNVNNPLGTKGELVNQFGNLMKMLWSNKYLYVVPSDFKRVLGNFAPQFSGYQQQDSQELLAFLLDLLHEDLNRVKEKPALETITPLDKTDLQLADEAWQKHLARNHSFIVDLFQGQLKSTLLCEHCNRNSVAFDPFMYLSLPIPTSSERIVEVVYFPMDGRPTKYGVRVPKLSEVRDLKTALANLVGKSPLQLMLCDIYGSRNYPIADWKYLFDIRKTDVVFGYEVLPPKESTAVPDDSGKKEAMDIELSTNYQGKNTTSVDIDMSDVSSIADGDMKMEITDSKFEVKSNGNGKHSPHPTQKNTGITNLSILQRKIISPLKAELFGFPLVCSFETGITTNAQLHQVVSQKVQRMIEFENNLPKVQFNIRVVNSSGRYCGLCKPSGECIGCELPNDNKPVTLNDEHAISIDWENKDVNVVFAEDRVQKYIIQDVSLRRTEEEEKNRTVSLDDCLQLFTKSEKLTAENRWHCPHCKQSSQAVKKLDIWRLPENLIVHLKRFQFTSVFRDKLTELVDFPLLDFDIKKYITNPNEINTQYELYAVSNHMGGLGSGHYTCFAKHPESKKWFHYNDTSSSEVQDESSIVSSDAYILFYKRKTPSKIFDYIQVLKNKLKEKQDKLQEPKPEEENKENVAPTVQLNGVNHHPPVDGPISRPDKTNSPNSIEFDGTTRRGNRYNNKRGPPTSEEDDIERNPSLLQIVPYQEGNANANEASTDKASSTDNSGSGGLQCAFCSRANFLDDSDVQVHMLTDCTSSPYLQ